MVNVIRMLAPYVYPEHASANERENLTPTFVIGTCVIGTFDTHFERAGLKRLLDFLQGPVHLPQFIHYMLALQPTIGDLCHCCRRRLFRPQPDAQTRQRNNSDPERT